MDIIPPILYLLWRMRRFPSVASKPEGMKKIESPRRVERAAKKPPGRIGQ